MVLMSNLEADQAARRLIPNVRILNISRHSFGDLLQQGLHLIGFSFGDQFHLTAT